MRILHIYKDYYPILGGIENHVRVLAEAQARAGHHVTVLVAARGPRTVIEEIGGVQVIKAGRLTTVASAPLSLSLPAIVARLRPDITHLHFPYPLGEAAHTLLGRARRTVITYHSDIVRQQGLLRFYRPLLWRVLAKADRIIATSPNYIATSPYLQPFADKCVVIPLGIDADRFSAPDPAHVAAFRNRILINDERRSKEGISANQPPSALLLFVGRLRYYKGLDDLLRALTQVPAHLLVGGSGPMEQPWRALAQQLGVAERVHFLGDVPDELLPSLYHAADIFVLPANARAEAFGTVLLEAMAAGLPAISTEVGTGTSYVNRQGETGLVVPPHDPEALARAINTLLSDADLRKRLGEQARLRAHRPEFSQAHMVQQVLELYHELLAASLATSGPGNSDVDRV